MLSNNLAAAKERLAKAEIATASLGPRAERFLDDLHRLRVCEAEIRRVITTNDPKAVVAMPDEAQAAVFTAFQDAYAARDKALGAIKEKWTVEDARKYVGACSEQIAAQFAFDDEVAKQMFVRDCMKVDNHV